MNKGRLVAKDQLHQMYIVEQLPMHTIARDLDLSIGTVFNYLKKYDIPTRPKSETFNMRGKKHSKEACIKISNFHRGKIVSEATKQKMSEAFRLHGPGHTKLRGDGYVGVYCPDHDQSTADGYVMQHRLIMEEYIGQQIGPDRVVHHKNGCRNDNRIENLCIMSISQHAGYHMKIRQAMRRAQS